MSARLPEPILLDPPSVARPLAPGIWRPAGTLAMGQVDVNRTRRGESGAYIFEFESYSLKLKASYLYKIIRGTTSGFRFN
jgi:hypothetical protein